MVCASQGQGSDTQLGANFAASGFGHRSPREEKMQSCQARAKGARGDGREGRRWLKAEDGRWAGGTGLGAGAGTEPSCPFNATWLPAVLLGEALKQCHECLPAPGSAAKETQSDPMEVPIQRGKCLHISSRSTEGALSRG